MKTRLIHWMVPVLAISLLGACKKKEQATTAPEPPAVAEEAAATPAPAPAVVEPPKLDPEQRAAMLGFARHLPQQTELVISIHDGGKTLKRIKSGKLWRALNDEVVDEEDEGLEAEVEAAEAAAKEAAEELAEADAEESEEAPVGPAALFGKEFTIALGPTVGEQTANLLTLQKRLTYFQMRALAAAFAEAVQTGDMSTMETALQDQFGAQLGQDLLNDPDGGVALFERMAMPPLYLAFKTSAEGRDAAAQQIATMTENLGMLGPVVEALEVERAGGTFAGYKIVGAKVAESMGEMRASMEQMLEPAAVDRLISAVAAKDLVVLSGTLGDYVVMFIGASADQLQLASNVGESLVAGDALAFCDGYAGKELSTVIHGSEQAITTMINAAGGLSHISEGLRDGLASAEGMGDTRDLETLLRMVAEREKAMRALSSTGKTGVVAFFEEGLKIESYGGTDYGMVDWKAENRLAKLGEAEDVALFVNMTGNPVYEEKARLYVEALVETAYAMAMKVAEAPGDDPQLADFKKMAKLFDSSYRADALALWQALSGDFDQGLGNEAAWIIDLKGSVPTIPGLPQNVVDEGKFPRMSVVAPVSDRAKLASAWQQVNTSAAGILAKIGELQGKEIPMQKPISSEKDGFTTWFFPLPFFNDDFVPSVTVGDAWFAASTSKNQALDLLGQASAASGKRKGMWLEVDFDALRKFAEISLEVISKNPDALPMDEEDLDQFRKLVDAMEELEQLTIHARQENGVLRTSMHLKTR